MGGINHSKCEDKGVTIIGKFIKVDEIEDYLVQRYKENKPVLERNSVFEIVGMLFMFSLVVLELFISMTVAENIKFLENLHPIITVFSGFAITIILATLTVLTFSILYVVFLIKGERIIESKIVNEIFKWNITKEDVELGYKLKVVEEFNYKGYKELVSGSYSELIDNIDKLYKEVIDDLNTEVELSNGYITRKYELVATNGEDILITNDIKELGGINITNTEKLTEDNFYLKWYSKLSKVSQSLYELKSLEDVYRQIKLTEDKRMKSLGNQSVKELRLNNHNLREESLQYLAEDKHNKELKKRIDKVYEDKKEVIEGGYRIIDNAIK